MKKCTFMLLLLVTNWCYGQQSYEIMSYEYVERKTDENSDNPKSTFRYEFQNLFLKNGKEWQINDQFKPKKTTRIIIDDKLKTATLSLKADSTQYLPNRTAYYISKESIKLSDNFNKTFNVDWPFVKKLAFCTNNDQYQQRSKLIPYKASAKDVQLIKSNLFQYIKTLYTNNCADKLSEYSDSILVSDKVAPNIIVNNTETYIDQHGNKLLQFQFESQMAKWNIYPFNTNCFRADNGYGFPTLTVYIDKEGVVYFLSDEMTLLHYGDFDNDGKDEFLFFSSIFNHDKYVLYYDNFTKKTEYTWSYH